MSGRVPRWRRQPEERPKQILDAALEAFGEAGLSGARLEEIAERAGVSKGTIYLYFESKTELFREVIRQETRAVLEGLAVAAGTDRPAAEQLTGLLRSFWGYLRTSRFEAIYRLVVGELHRFPELAEFYAREVAGRVTELVAGVVERGVEAGEFRDTDPRAAARMLVALYTKHAIWCGRRELFVHLRDLSDERVLEEMEDFCAAALRPVGAGSRVGAAD